MVDVESFIYYGLVLLFLDLLLGVMFGWWLRGSRRTDDVSQLNPRQAMEALKRLQDLTRDVAARVGEHLCRVDAISRELVAITGNSNNPKERAVIDAVSQIVQMNETLSSQLVHAKLQLQDQQQTIEEQASLATIDLVTGLTNRRGFEAELSRRLAQWQQQEQPLSVLILDIDQLQHLHETRGPQAANDVLRGMAEVLNETMRAMDLIARYSEDQFAVLLPGTKLNEARVAADRLRLNVSERTFVAGPTPVEITVSEGVTDTLPGDDIKSLVKRANIALVASREAGRNCGHQHDGSHCSPIEPPSPEAASDTLHDLLQYAKNLRDTSFDSTIDGLTGLHNRRTFFETLRHRITEHNLANTSLCMLMIDLDQMENINKSNGQLVGDVVLRAVSQVIRAGTRTELDITARFEGARLAVVLVDTDLEAGLAIGDRLRRTVAACKLRAEGKEIGVTVTVGVAEMVRGSDSVELIKAAENAMRSAKAAGRNCVHFHDGKKIHAVAASIGVA